MIAAVFPEGRHELSPGWSAAEPWDSVSVMISRPGGPRRDDPSLSMDVHAIALSSKLTRNLRPNSDIQSCVFLFKRLTSNGLGLGPDLWSSSAANRAAAEAFRLWPPRCASCSSDCSRASNSFTSTPLAPTPATARFASCCIRQRPLQPPHQSLSSYGCGWPPWSTGRARWFATGIPSYLPARPPQAVERSLRLILHTIRVPAQSSP